MTTTPTRSTSTRTWALPLMALLLLVLSLASPGSAVGATYAVDACRHPDESQAPTHGWSPSGSGIVYTVDSCASNGALSASRAWDLEHDFSDFARWTFSAPTGTTIRQISGYRTSQAAPKTGSATPVTVIKTESGYFEECGTGFACMSMDGEFAYQLGAANSVSFGVECVYVSPAPCPAGRTSILARKLRVDLTDNASPTWTDPPSGSLTSPTSTARTRSLTYAASDTGGGLYRHRLLADGTEVLSGPVDENAGRCVRHAAGGGFSWPVPCKSSASQSLTYDTAGLADGRHDLSLQVLDATDENKAGASWPILVDNVAPVVGEVSVAGVARVGETLRCSAPIDGQSPQVAYQWLRANADGSDAREISGAVAATYTLAAADVGRKLVCRVTAADGGGSTPRTSSATSGPFEGGPVAAAQETAGQGTAAGATPSAASSTLASAVGAANDRQGAPPLPVCTRATVTMLRTARRVTRAYRASAMTLSGRLTAVSGGGGVGGMALDVMQTVTRAGVAKRTRIAQVRTTIDGTFTARIPRGPTRSVQLVDAGCGSVGPTISQRVHGALLAKTTTRRIRNGQLARFSGRALGGYVGRGLPLELQVKVGRSWRDVKAVTTDSRGAFRVSYRFTRTFVRYTYRFRIVSRGGGAWPYTAARSRQVSVRVN